MRSTASRRQRVGTPTEATCALSGALHRNTHGAGIPTPERVPAAVNADWVRVKKTHLGSWALFCDLSGRVRQTIDNPIITSAAVAVPVDLVRPLRTRMRRLFSGDKMK